MKISGEGTPSVGLLGYARAVWDGSGDPGWPGYLRARRAVVTAHVAGEKYLPGKARTLKDVPADEADVTNEWLTAVLCRETPGAVVLSSETDTRSAGSSTRWRTVLHYNQAGTDAGLPASVFNKTTAAFKQRTMLGFIGIIAGEPAFFRDYRPKLDIEAPRGYHGGSDPRSWRSISVIEDLVATKQAEFVTPQRYVSKEHMQDLLSNMAVWHGTFWNSAEVAADRRLNNPFDYVRRAGQLFGMQTILDLGVARSGDVISPELVAQSNRAVAGLWKSLKLVSGSDGPSTLLHGDPHIGNTYLTGAGKAGFTDWQIIQRGSWVYDFSYLVNGGLTVENRQEWDRELLDFYLERLAEAGGTPPSSDDAWRKYRQQALWPYFAWLSTIGHGEAQPDMQPDVISKEMVKRTAAAVVDHETFALLDAI